MTAREPYRLDGPDNRREKPGLLLALRALYYGRRGPATEADRPLLSTFPMTPAAREALRLTKGSIS